MTWRRHTKEQVIAVLRMPEQALVFRNFAANTASRIPRTIKLQTKYAGLDVSDVKKLHPLQDKNRRLKQLVAEQALDIQTLKVITTKHW